MSNTVVLPQKRTPNIQCGTVVVKNDEAYMVTRGNQGVDIAYYNLVNLKSGGRYSIEMTLYDLIQKIKKDNFEILGDVQIVIREKKGDA